MTEARGLYDDEWAGLVAKTTAWHDLPDSSPTVIIGQCPNQISSPYPAFPLFLPTTMRQRLRNGGGDNQVGSTQRLLKVFGVDYDLWWSAFRLNASYQYYDDPIRNSNEERTKRQYQMRARVKVAVPRILTTLKAVMAISAGRTVYVGAFGELARKSACDALYSLPGCETFNRRETMNAMPVCTASGKIHLLLSRHPSDRADPQHRILKEIQNDVRKWSDGWLGGLPKTSLYSASHAYFYRIR